MWRTSALLYLLLVGCEASFEARFARVTPEQSRDAVVRLLGSPDRAQRFDFDPLVMGPPEVLLGMAAEGQEMEELTWERQTSDGTVVFQVYFRDEQVLATTLHPAGAVF